MASGSTFEMTQCLGRGGFGEVYLATQVSGGISKRVAVKVLQTERKKGSQALERLRDEARILAALEHPAILTVHELTRLKGRVALVAEYIDGVDLSRCCRPGVLLPPRVALEVVAEVASALDCAWNTPSPRTGEPLHLVHRDVKPENIRLSKHGEVKLLDFGIARTHELAREAMTVAGHMPFTPGYAPPELFGSDPHVGHYTDVFALGATMYRLLVGERFYEGKKLKAQLNLSAAAEDYEPYLHSRLQQVSGGGLRQALLGCLAFRPEDRLTAAELGDRLHALADAMEGPTRGRWARGITFPPPVSVKGASLTGQTLHDDDNHTVQIRRPLSTEQIAKEKAPATVLLSPSQLRPAPRAPPRTRWWLVVGLVVVIVLVVVPVAAVFGATVVGAGMWWL